MLNQLNRGRIGRTLFTLTLFVGLAGCDGVDDDAAEVETEERAQRFSFPSFSEMSFPEVVRYLKETQQIPATATVNNVDQLISSLPGGDPTFTCNNPLWSGHDLPDGAKLDIVWCCDNGFICIPEQITFTPKGQAV